MIYASPAAFRADANLNVPLIVGWQGENKSSSDHPDSALATVNISVYGWDDPSAANHLPNKAYYLANDDELRDTFTVDFARRYPFKTIYLKVMSGMGSSAPIGRSYVYELRDNSVTAPPRNQACGLMAKRSPLRHTALEATTTSSSAT